MNAPGHLTEDERFDLGLLRAAVRYQRWVIGTFGPALGGDVLEVGAGVGNFTRWIAEQASHLTAIEPDQDMAAEITNLGVLNLEVLPVPLEGLDGDSRKFDSVVMINVLEHIREDSRALRMAYELLREGGRLFLFVPAHPFMHGSLDEAYHHFRRYTRGQVGRLLAEVGFRVERSTYFNPIGALGWLLVARILRKRRLSRASIRLTEWVAVPLGRTLGHLGSPPFGQSVVGVGQRVN